jgi:hypothetical protein
MSSSALFVSDIANAFTAKLSRSPWLTRVRMVACLPFLFCAFVLFCAATFIAGTDPQRD